MKGMNALRFRGEQKKKAIRYDYSMLNHTNLVALENILKKYKVNYWLYNGYIFTYDEDKFSEALHYFNFGEEN